MGIISKLKNVLGLTSNSTSHPQDDYSPSIPQEPPTEDDSTEPTLTEADIQEPDQESDPTIDDEPPGDPVDTIKGIGPSYAEKLGKAGVNTVDELANADPASLAEQTGIAESRIQNWIDQAAA